MESLRVSPADFGLPPHSIDELRSGSAHDNVQTLLAVLRGEPSAVSDWVLMNTSAALVCAGRAADWKDGVTIARAAIADGSALQLAQQLRPSQRRSAAAEEAIHSGNNSQAQSHVYTLTTTPGKQPNC